MSLHPIWPMWVWAILALATCALWAAPLVRRLAGGPRTARPDHTARTARAARAARTARAACAQQAGLWRRGGLALLVLVMALGPSQAFVRDESAAAGVEIFFVVDRTGSMAAEDYAGTQPRLEGVRADIDAIVEAFPGARYAVIAWDSSATQQLPLTTDARAVESWTATLRQEITAFSSGSQLDRPLAVVSATIAAAAERAPGNVRLVYFLSDGENTDGDASLADAVLGSYAGIDVDGGAVLGYGTVEGGRMRVNDPRATDDPGYIQDPATGEDAVSHLDEDTLRSIASQLGVPYLHRTSPGGIEAATAGVDLAALAADGRAEVTEYRPVLWPFAAAALALLAWEAWALTRALPRRTRGAA